VTTDATVNGTTVLTASGSLLDLADPSTWDGDMGAVAQGLSNTCRFGGQIGRFYSVAEHSVLVASAVARAGGDARLQLAGLLHDAHEAFYGDIVRPMKALVGADLLALMSAFDGVIERRFNLVGCLHHPLVKTADDLLLRWEASALWTPAPTWSLTPPSHFRAVGYVPHVARDLFEGMLSELLAALAG